MWLLHCLLNEVDVLVPVKAHLWFLCLVFALFLSPPHVSESGCGAVEETLQLTLQPAVDTVSPTIVPAPSETSCTLSVTAALTKQQSFIFCSELTVKQELRRFNLQIHTLRAAESEEYMMKMELLCESFYI